MIRAMQYASSANDPLFHRSNAMKAIPDEEDWLGSFNSKIATPQASSVGTIQPVGDLS
jgi:hypothetical protein